MGLTLAVGITLGVMGSALLAPRAGVVNVFNLDNSELPDTPVTRTMRGAAGTRVRLYSVDAWCSDGTSSLTVVDGNVTIWRSAAAEVRKSRFRVTWNPGLSAGWGKDMTISLGSCGPGNVGTLIIHAERF